MATSDFSIKLLAVEKSLKCFALSLTRDVDDAKDLVQETFLRAMQYQDKYIYDENMKAWLFTILRNTYLNHVTKLSSKKTVSDNTEDEYLLRNTLFDNKTVEVDLNVTNICKEISNLEVDYKIPFQMFLDGFKYKEIAEQTKLPIGTIKSRIFFARRILVENLQEFKD